MLKNMRPYGWAEYMAGEMRARLDPALRDEWCWSAHCPDTNWGGRGRRHVRCKEAKYGTPCPPREQSDLTAPDDPRLSVDFWMKENVWE